MESKARNMREVLGALPPADPEKAAALLARERAGVCRKMVVLDDDPTGVQTVHDISVYTGWTPELVRQGFDEEESLFFILTNSRSFTAEQTREAHREMAEAIGKVSRETGKPFVLVSRSDSTLRGHYPLETETLRQVLETDFGLRYDGEILCPFFLEGGRYTVGNIHYVQEGEMLIPAGETEFAKDATFGYRSSDLARWCEEKTGGRYPADQVVSIPLEELRALDVEGIAAKLSGVKDFGKVIVNAADPADIQVFLAAFFRVLKAGKEFLFRGAAAIPKALGGVADRPLLTHGELVDDREANGGIVLVGSHVKKTTRQLEALKESACAMRWIPFNAQRVLEPGGLEKEARQAARQAEACIRQGQTAVVYTSRELVRLDTADREQMLEASVQISAAVTSVIARLTEKPAFLVAKGGITSSDVGTKALRVRKARVMGQIAPGIPVWMTGEESKFPGMPYVIFPGNVGGLETLREVVEKLAKK